VSDSLWQRVLQRLRRVEREKVSWKQAVVTGNSPLTIKLNGSETEVQVSGIDGLGYNVNDVVTVLVRDRDMLALGGSTSTPGGVVVYAAGDGLDLASGVFSLDLKSSGGLKITSTELAADFGSGAGKAGEIRLEKMGRVL
jgi:hypothetical protein